MLNLSSGIVLSLILLNFLLITTMLKKIISEIFHRRPFHAVPASVSDPDYEVCFEYSGRSVPLNKQHSLVALKPLLIAINQPAHADLIKGNLTIKHKGKLLGSLELEQTDRLNSGIGIYKVKQFRNAIVDPAWMAFNSFYLFMQNRSNPQRMNTIMPVRSQHQMHVYYLVPRPVALITAGQPDAFDLFPMDNIGYVNEHTFLLGLRKTSPALQKLNPGDPVCISYVPYERKNDAYALGTHHTNGLVHGADLNFELIASRMFALPVPEFALDVIEGTIAHRQPFGSHMLLQVAIKNEYRQHTGPVLAHIPWFMKHRQTHA